MVGDCLMEAT